MENKIPSVSELTNAISILLEEGLGQVTVLGEISNFKQHSSGHRYFTLKDEYASIACVLWKGKPLNFLPVDGMKVIVTGHITVFPPRGQYQIECISIKPLGKGELYLAFELLKKKLSEAGYFDTKRKRAIPSLPLKIGVVTSSTGAAIRDIISTIRRRLQLCRIYFRPTLVQGEGSAEDIASAINELNNFELDVIIVGRGGGSIEDLWSFNTEIVANAIYNSKIPIISAVGHETDFTISDFVADLRAATPTAAAEIVTPRTKEDLQTFLKESQFILYKTSKNRIDNLKRKIIAYRDIYAFRKVIDRIHNNIQFIDESQQKIQSRVRNTLTILNQRVHSLELHCKSLNPLAPLKKGFALLKSKNDYISKEVSLNKYKQVKIIRENETALVSVLNVVDNDFLFD